MYYSYFIKAFYFVLIQHASHVGVISMLPYRWRYNPGKGNCILFIRSGLIRSRYIAKRENGKQTLLKWVSERPYHSFHVFLHFKIDDLVQLILTLIRFLELRVIINGSRVNRDNLHYNQRD